MDTKQNIRLLVTEYRRIFADEYAQFLVGMRAKKANIDITNKFSEMKGADYIDRALLEYPETLSVIFEQKLSKEDYTWFRSKVGARWFGKTFKEFEYSK